MRWMVGILLLGLAGPLQAGRLDAPPAQQPADPLACRNYALELGRAVNQISAIYVKPVSPLSLYLAALNGLYRQANQPFPASVKADLEKCLKDYMPQFDGEEPDPQTVAVIARARVSLGNPKALQSPADLVASLQAMFRELDPHSGLITAGSQQRMGLRQPYGIGMEFSDEESSGPCRVKSVVPGGPAQRAGIRPGNWVTHVNGTPIKAGGSQTRQLLANFLQPKIVPTDQGGIDYAEADKFELTLRAKQSRKVSLQAEKLRVETVFGFRRDRGGSWNYLIDPQKQMGYVRLGELEWWLDDNGRGLQKDSGTAADLEQALLGLRLKGLVLDLRWCPGGYLNAAVGIAKLFVKEGVLAKAKYRDPRLDKDYQVQGSGAFLEFPIVVLVNGETTGGGELIAAALKDSNRAVVVGQRTRGKGSIQQPLSLRMSGLSMKLTTGSFVRPNGKNLQRWPTSTPADDWGIRPSPGMAIPITADMNRYLKEQWLEMSLRPAENKQALPLDDLENDPQLQEALKVLERLQKAAADKKRKASAGKKLTAR